MPIQFRCNNCRQLLSVSRKKAGATVNCPSCKASIQVPELEPSPAENEGATLVESPEPQAESRTPSTASEETLFAPAPVVDAIPPIATPPKPSLDDEDEDEEPYVSKQKFERDAIDMTAMVDVTFLLLIFFMVTASFAAQKVMERSAPQPEETEEGASAITATSPEDELPENSVIVEIDANNQITFEGRPIAGLGELRDLLTNAFNSDIEVAVLIQAQYSTRHGTLVAVSDAAMSAGITRIIPQIMEDDD